MTKYEWEKELKMNIHRLPDDEIQRVMDYYGELFEDNIERGKSEREIISEFGNPVDVADRILSEYDGELKPESVFDTPPKIGDDVHRNKSDENAKDVFDEYPDDKKKDACANKSPVTVENRTNKDAANLKLAVFLIINFVTGFAFVIVAAVVWIVLGAVVAACGGICVGGAAMVVVSFGPLFGGALGSGLVHLGVGIGFVGFGILGVYGCVCIIRMYAKFTSYCFKQLRA